MCHFISSYSDCYSEHLGPRISFCWTGSQAILKRSLKHTCSIVPLMKRSHTNNLEFFLSNIGKVYMSG